MDCKLSKTKPRPTHHLLYQQVEEQSELCDVTVKMGNWEKLFHWCVLVSSPFFENIYKNGFLEKQTGQVRFHVGTPSVVETCLLYLYGKFPELTEDNISGIIEVAEFLMLPNLKATCIQWVHAQRLTADNCYRMLELASIYEFEMPTCREYIRGHLPEMLQKNEMLNITKDTLEYILSDPTLCYCGMEDKFLFLTRWTKATLERHQYFPELFQFIKIKDLSRDFIETVVKKECLVTELNNIDNLFVSSKVCNDEEAMLEVLILDSTSRTMNCLDLQKKVLYRVDVREQEKNNKFMYQGITGVNALNNSDVYKVRKGNSGNYETSLLIKNLANDLTMKTKFVIMSDQADYRGPSFIIGYKECFVIEKSIHKISTTSYCPKNLSESDDEENDDDYEAIQRRYELILAGFDLTETTLTSRSKITSRNINVTTIYKGVLKEGVTAVHSILSIPNLSFTSVCINKANVVALLSDNNDTIFLYDQNSCELDKMLLQTEYHFEHQRYRDKLAPSTKGFVIYNDERVFCLTRIAGPSLQTKYKTYLYEFDQERKLMEYRFFENQWYRFYNGRNTQEESTLSYTTHDEILATEGGREITWTYVSLPESTKSIGSSVFSMYIPKSKLKCHVDCPHCHQAIPPTSRFSSLVYGDLCSESSSNDSSSSEGISYDDGESEYNEYYYSSD